MNNYNKFEIKRFNKNFSNKMMLKLISRYFIFTVLTFAICTNTKYFAHIFIIILVLIIGYTIIFVHLWKQILNNITEIVTSVASIYDSNQQNIKLSDELEEVEILLNNIKNDIELNKQLAKDSEKKKNDLIVYLAHDLKTPLTSILGYLTILRTEKNLDDKVKSEYMNITFEKAERLEELIDEFFEITKFNSSSVKLELQEVNISLLLEQILFEFNPILKMNNLDINITIENNIYIKCDANRIERVIDNILKNAVSYSNKPSTIYVNIYKDEENIYIEFENEGDMISEADIKQIFEQFFRSDSSRNSEKGGSGLGLAISKEIVELHGGNISAKSEDNKFKIKVVFPTV
ncbi:MAG: sensor histidine kinase [Paraclostridium sp.]